MPIIKGPVEIIRTVAGQPIGHGFAYLRLGPTATGTITQLEWQAEPAEVGEAIRIVFEDGRQVEAVCTRGGATACGPEIVRFTAT